MRITCFVPKADGASHHALRLAMLMYLSIACKLAFGSWEAKSMSQLYCLGASHNNLSLCSCLARAGVIACRL